MNRAAFEILSAKAKLNEKEIKKVKKKRSNLFLSEANAPSEKPASSRYQLPDISDLIADLKPPS